MPLRNFRNMPATDLRPTKAPMVPFAKELSAQLTEDLSPFAPSKSIESSVRLRLPPPLQKEALAIYPSLFSFPLLFRFFLPFSDYHQICLFSRNKLYHNRHRKINAEIVNFKAKLKNSFKKASAKNHEKTYCMHQRLLNF